MMRFLDLNIGYQPCTFSFDKLQRGFRVLSDVGLSVRILGENVAVRYRIHWRRFAASRDS